LYIILLTTIYSLLSNQVPSKIPFSLRYYLEVEGGLLEYKGLDYIKLGLYGVLKIGGGGLLLLLSLKKKGWVVILVLVVLLPAKSLSTTFIILG